MKSFEQKDLLGMTIEQHGACGYVFHGECLKEHQLGRQACKECKWKVGDRATMNSLFKEEKELNKLMDTQYNDDFKVNDTVIIIIRQPITNRDVEVYAKVLKFSLNNQRAKLIYHYDKENKTTWRPITQIFKWKVE
jgi:hypothetical protein